MVSCWLINIKSLKYVLSSSLKTRKTTFIKAKIKKSDGQTNIDEFKVAYGFAYFILG